MANLDMSGAVSSANPSNAPMTETGYFKWLESKAPTDIHAIKTRRQYLEEVFGFVVGEHRINEDVINTLKCVHTCYFDCKIKPSRKWQNNEETH